MASERSTEIRDVAATGDSTFSEEDPKPIVNYTIGMIITFVILALIAIFAIGVYFSTSQSGRGTDAGQSEQRANP